MVVKHKHYVYIEAHYNPARRNEVGTWCDENVESYLIDYNVPYPYLRWCFVSKEDAMAFKLRWI